ncbi:DUF4249 domain-containing protein [Pollutibacter soli]|uniref:DUF4249 domain-containing protein n=1 Tax=Pollutibacter soli TaxID=3034157 RepID=UPI003013EE8E
MTSVNSISIRLKKALAVLVMVVLVTACREKFEADLPSPATGYLIVEGIINVGDEAVTMIKLSRTTPLDSRAVTPENNAQVFIEDEQNHQYELALSDSGQYYSQPLDLPVNVRYRLHVIADAKEYYSGFTDTKIAPEIDNLYWEPKTDGIEIQLDTDDPLGNSRYYYWNFTETWEYNVPYFAVLKYIQASNTVDYRGAGDPEIFKCYHTLESSSIVIASTAKLSQDLVFAKPITFVSATNTSKLVNRYSIIVRQSVLSKDAYEYFERMKKNTEQTGSIFDAQPSQLRGNIKCKTDSSEIVVGYISTSSITEKRIFVSRVELPAFNHMNPFSACMLDTVKLHPDSLREAFYYGSNLPIDYWTNDAGIRNGVVGSASFCVDCREQGGSNVRPSFW